MPAADTFILAVVWPPGLHKYVNGPLPSAGRAVIVVAPPEQKKLFPLIDDAEMGLAALNVTLLCEVQPLLAVAVTVYTTTPLTPEATGVAILAELKNVDGVHDHVGDADVKE